MAHNFSGTDSLSWVTRNQTVPKDRLVISTVVLSIFVGINYREFNEYHSFMNSWIRILLIQCVIKSCTFNWWTSIFVDQVTEQNSWKLVCIQHIFWWNYSTCTSRQPCPTTGVLLQIETEILKVASAKSH